jgi:tetratricopeptide (TPR) repeat protein
VEGPYYEIPSLQVSQYVDRVELLREIESNFANTLGSASDRRIVVLLGMGGQGKTQLALEYCRMVKALGTYKGIFWIDASSPNTVSRGFETIMEKISGRGQAIDDIESKVAFVKDTLESWEEPWIMVFDNYDRPGEFKDISSYFPQGRTGMLLFTSRHADSERLGVAIKITQMTIEEGLELLLRRSKLQRNSGNTVEGKKIIQKLAYLPLAIDQAGAYIAARVIPLQLFVKHYDERKEVVLKHTPLLWEYRRRLDEGKDETLLSVFTTWELSFQQVGKYEEERIMICRFLTLSAFFDATNISEHLFISHLALIRKPPQWMEQFISEGVWDQFKYQDILVELRGLSLLQDLNIGSEETSFSLHPLVIDWLKLRIDQKSRWEYIIEATMVLGNYIGKQNVEALPLQVRLDMVSHVDIYLQNRREYLRELDESDMASLWRHIFYFANLYLYHGRYQEAEVMYQQSLIGCVRAVGPDHESTLDTVQNLGILYRNQSRFAEAETMYERALTGYEKSLGLDHESTLNTIICLGLVYINQDRLTEAEATLGRALTRCERALGLDHLSTLSAVHSLGIVYNKQRRVAEAQAMFERAFTGCEKSLGSDHESTLNTVQSLGILYDEQGKFAEAETMYERALTGYEKSLGPNHKWTLNTIICLGLFYINQDRLTEAEATLGRALTGCERTLGLNNLSTLDTIHNLGILYRKQNRVVEAEAAFDRALMGYDKLLGPDHGSTLEMVMGLVGLYKNQGKLAKVEALYQRHQSWAATQADSRSL